MTRRDILAYVEKGRGQAPAAARAGRPMPAFTPGEDIRIEKMSVMRKKIAEHMVLSARTSPHVYSVYEVDFHRVEQLRQARKAAYEQAGTRLTYTAFVARAVIEAIREFPFANASLDGDNIVYKRDINLGIAVALDAGLIVPVIKDAAARDMIALCRAIQDLAHRARSKQLKPEDVQGGTFTITNPGVFGAAFGLPLINQPQVAILGVGAIEKRVVVVDDMIAVHPMCYLSLGYDHRLIDGADAGRFLQSLKDASGAIRRSLDVSRSFSVRRLGLAEYDAAVELAAKPGRGAASRADRRHTAAAGASADHYPRRQDAWRIAQRACLRARPRGGRRARP